MAEARGRVGTRERGSVTLRKDDWKHLASVGSLLAVALGALVMGAVLQLDAAPPETAAVTPRPAPATDDGELPVATVPLVAAEPRPAPAAVSPADRRGLAGRVSADLERLGGNDGWLLQIAAHCDPENVERTLRETDSRRLHVLPVEIGRQACFRICWGPFDSRAAAEAAVTRLPSALRSAGDAPRPRLVADLIQ